MKQTKNPISPQEKVPKSVVVMGVVIVLLALGWIGGVNGYLITYIGCGKPPISASDFAASFSYEIPGDEGYGPGLFQKYFCTEDAARNAGYRRSSDVE